MYSKYENTFYKVLRSNTYMSLTIHQAVLNILHTLAHLTQKSYVVHSAATSIFPVRKMTRREVKALFCSHTSIAESQPQQSPEGSYPL